MRPTPPPAAKSQPLFDWAAFRDWAWFVWHSVFRNPRVGAAVLAAVVAVTLLVAVLLPRRYASSTRLLTRPVGFMASLADPYGRPAWDETPTRAARERVLSRDSLRKIAQQTGLIEHWQRTRGPVLAVRDLLQQLYDGAWDEEDWGELVTATLEKQLQVSGNDETVDISVEWHDAAMARQIVETASQNFVETRHVTELAAISEAIGILEQHEAQTQDAVYAALEELIGVVRERSRGDTRDLPSAAAPGAPPRTAWSQSLAQLKFMLRAKQRALAELRDQQTRALAQARAALDQQLVIYNRAHPAIADLERKVDALKRPSLQLLQLERDVSELERDIAQKGGKADRAPGLAAPPAQNSGLVTEASLASLPVELERDPAVTVAQEQLRVAMGRHQQLQLRLESARLALDTARAAFKYRFRAVRPAQTPRQALSPNVPLILLSGAFLGLVLAFFACAGLDLWRRRLCESWQIQRQLRLPVLLALRRPGT